MLIFTLFIWWKWTGSAAHRAPEPAALAGPLAGPLGWGLSGLSGTGRESHLPIGKTLRRSEKPARAYGGRLLGRSLGLPWSIAVSLPPIAAMSPSPEWLIATFAGGFKRDQGEQGRRRGGARRGRAPPATRPRRTTRWRASPVQTNRHHIAPPVTLACHNDGHRLHDIRYNTASRRHPPVDPAALPLHGRRNVLRCGRLPTISLQAARKGKALGKAPRSMAGAARSPAPQSRTNEQCERAERGAGK